MISATEFIEIFLNAVHPPRGVAIVVTERAPLEQEETNWNASHGADPLPLQALSRFDSALTEMRRQYPRIDWTGVTEKVGDMRRIARWLSEV